MSAALTIRLAQFARFSVVGAIGTACHYAVLVVLVQGLAVAAVPASVAGSIVGAIVNYLLNRSVTFSSRRGHLDAGLRFAAVALAGLALNAALMAAFVGALGLHYLVAQVLATVAVLIWNYAGNAFWTFRE
jgi:putative flippase GtrA